MVTPFLSDLISFHFLTKKRSFLFKKAKQESLLEIKTITVLLEP